MKCRLYHIVLCFLLIVMTPACNNKRKEAQSAHTTKEQDVYTCPMHPEIIRNAPGSCPICGMDLVKKETGNQALEDKSLDMLLKPSNSFVVSSVPVIALEQRDENVELKVIGTVAYDNDQMGAISSRVGGRIEKLYIRYKYQPVKKGQRIMDIYSPELMTAQQNLLFLLRNDAGNTALIDAAKDRLSLLGMPASQIATLVRTRKPDYSVAVFSQYSGFVTDLNADDQTGGMSQPNSSQTLNVREGMYVQSGQAVFTVYNPDRTWILLDIFPEQQNLVQPGNSVIVIPETAPGISFRARIDYLEPLYRSGSKTLTARIYFNNKDLRLPVGSRVTATISGKSIHASWLPVESVLSLGREKIVFKKEQGGFRTHTIKTGIEINRYIRVHSGLKSSDSVAANARFLVDNEAFIKINEQ